MRHVIGDLETDVDKNKSLNMKGIQGYSHY